MAVGVHSIAKTTGQMWAEGQPLYWNVGTSKVDSNVTSGPLVGVAAAPATSSSQTGAVRLNGGAPAAAEGPQAAITDLVAITGGDSPTEVEHNAVITKMNAILAALRAFGVIAST
jgi:hypothetical protein